MNTLTIGQLAQRAGVHVESVRYYERRGLLPAPLRRESGYRQYAEADVGRLRFIKQAQALGFSLAEVGSLLLLRVDSKTTCADVKREAEAKITDIDRRIADLKRMKRALVRVTTACAGRGPASECSILSALERTS